MSLWRIYYHLVWATRSRLPMITPSVEAALYQYINDKARQMKCQIHAIGGIENHVHLVVSIPPTVAVSSFVKDIKGASSRYISLSNLSDEAFAWQQRFGVFSLGGKQLEAAVNYALNQKQHHAQGTINTALENCG